MGLCRGRRSSVRLHRLDLWHPLCQELLGFWLGLGLVHSLDCPLWSLWPHLHPLPPHSSPVGPDAHEERRLGRLGQYALVADHRHLLHCHLCPSQSWSNHAHWSRHGLGEKGHACHRIMDSDDGGYLKSRNAWKVHQQGIPHSGESEVFETFHINRCILAMEFVLGARDTLDKATFAAFHPHFRLDCLPIASLEHLMT